MRIAFLVSDIMEIAGRQLKERETLCNFLLNRFPGLDVLCRMILSLSHPPSPPSVCLPSLWYTWGHQIQVKFCSLLHFMTWFWGNAVVHV